ncbi:hypothetical protein LAZ67_3002570 [Cordylochernes scorpioides]|uniref:RNase H type-1 domain-containing protein n=1 Tax=Cordylochernes scorpioides TaxID=51811 RepID=A0ABY6KAT1_9ARAC|nr:hypothetical protein LAZ67_3002570 [Cordylochernes scorpioides]
MLTTLPMTQPKIPQDIETEELGGAKSIYIDGSLVENGSSGSVFIILKHSMEIKRRIKKPKNLSVFRSELTAILKVLKLIDINETKNIIIYTYSKAAIFAIKNCFYSQDRLLKNNAAEINN